MATKTLETIDLKANTAYIKGLGEITVSPRLRVRGLLDWGTLEKARGALKHDKKFDTGVKRARTLLNEWRGKFSR